MPPPDASPPNIHRRFPALHLNRSSEFSTSLSPRLHSHPQHPTISRLSRLMAFGSKALIDYDRIIKIIDSATSMAGCPSCSRVRTNSTNRPPCHWRRIPCGVD